MVGEGRTKSYKMIRKGNVAIPVGRYGAGDKESIWGMSLASTPRHSRHISRTM